MNPSSLVAGIQAPTIYRLFGDKDGLLKAVAEQVMATHVSAKAAIVEAASAGDVDPLVDLRAGWQTQIDFGVTNPPVSPMTSTMRSSARFPPTHLSAPTASQRRPSPSEPSPLDSTC